MADAPCAVCTICKPYCLYRGVMTDNHEAQQILERYKDDYVRKLMLRAQHKQKRIWLKLSLLNEICYRDNLPEFGFTISQTMFLAVSREIERYNSVLTLYEQKYDVPDLRLFGEELTDPPMQQDNLLLHQEGFYTNLNINDLGMWPLFHETQPQAVVNYITRPIITPPAV